MISNGKEILVVSADELLNNIVDEFASVGLYNIVGDFDDIINRTNSRVVYDWIPVEEDLPDDWDNCLVTLKNGTVSKAWYNGTYWSNNTSKYLKTVIAWMPFPEPYKVTKKN